MALKYPCKSIVFMSSQNAAGGGGEAGPASRCPEAQLSQLVDAGITTAVGVLGADSITRSQVCIMPRALTFTGHRA